MGFPDTGDKEFPVGAGSQPPDATVQVLMTEEMARRFEQECLGKGNTKGDTYLAGPLLFDEEDVPTYIIGVRDLHERGTTDGDAAPNASA